MGAPLLVSLSLLFFCGLARARAGAAAPKPNILFIIMDDVGIDQLGIFNPSATVTAPTRNIDTIAANGVKFTRFWTMPECSPSRTCYFTGRYPVRTGVTAAILDQDLPVSQTSLFETTAPRVLRAAGYRSAMIGKYHLGGPSNNPLGDRAPVDMGWDFFDGSLEGVPPSIDSTLGGQYTASDSKQKFPCGFPTGDPRGACWFRTRSGRLVCDDNRGQGYLGQECVALGGIPALDANGNFASTAAQAAGPPPDFDRGNAYYTWPRVTLDATTTRHRTAHRYATQLQTDAAIDWIRSQSTGGDADQPWMCTVSYNAAHTPYQQPPLELYPPGFQWPQDVPQTPADPRAKRILSDLMIYAMDQEIGRLLVRTGLADRKANGKLVPRPAFANTMVIIAGDNGSYYPGVKSPYNPFGAKGTPYQTGVTTPLIVAGSLVTQPGRSVDKLVNCVDLFQLFGEIAGQNVRSRVPPSHALDSAPVLPYLQNPGQTSMRRYSFTQTGAAIKPTSVHAWPTVLQIGPAKVGQGYLFTSQDLAEDNGGEWFGPSAEYPNGRYATCCEVKANVYPNLVIAPKAAWAIRDERYKLVLKEANECEGSGKEYEFYDLKPTASNPVGLDQTNLLDDGDASGLTPAQLRKFKELKAALHAILHSEPDLPGDGNRDRRVDVEDLRWIDRFAGQPSWYDFNNDGTTDDVDRQVVVQNFGRRARG